MKHGAATSMKNRKVWILAGGSVLAIACTVYFVLFYPPVSSQDSTGTIGAVQKYQSNQLAEKDVVLAGNMAESLIADGATQISVTKIGENAKELASVLEGKRWGKMAEGLLAGARELAKSIDARQATQKSASEGATALQKTAGEGVKELSSAKMELRLQDAAHFAEGAQGLAEQAREFAQKNAEGRGAVGAKTADLLAASQQLSKSAVDAATAIMGSELRYANDAARELQNAATELRAAGKTAEAAKLQEAAKELGAHAEGSTSLSKSSLEGVLANGISARENLQSMSQRMTDLSKLANGLKAEGRAELAKSMENGVLAWQRASETAKVLNALASGVRSGAQARPTEGSKGQP